MQTAESAVKQNSVCVHCGVEEYLERNGTEQSRVKRRQRDRGALSGHSGFSTDHAGGPGQSDGWERRGCGSALHLSCQLSTASYSFMIPEIAVLTLKNLSSTKYITKAYARATSFPPLVVTFRSALLWLHEILMWSVFSRLSWSILSGDPLH